MALYVHRQPHRWRKNPDQVEKDTLSAILEEEAVQVARALLWSNRRRFPHNIAHCATFSSTRLARLVHTRDWKENKPNYKNYETQVWTECACKSTIIETIHFQSVHHVFISVSDVDACSAYSFQVNRVCTSLWHQWSVLYLQERSPSIWRKLSRCACFHHGHDPTRMRNRTIGHNYCLCRHRFSNFQVVALLPLLYLCWGRPVILLQSEEKNHTYLSYLFHWILSFPDVPIGCISVMVWASISRFSINFFNNLF